MNLDRAAVQSKGWHASALAPWSVRDGELIEDAVERDVAELVAFYGQVPTIARYAQMLDPTREPRAAESLLLTAFGAARAHAPQLAQAWRARWPEWQACIDRCLAASLIACDLDELAAPCVGLCVGPALDDGGGRYEIVRELGRGAWGCVFEVLDRTLSQCGAPASAALKMIPCARADVAQRLREAGTARAISHGGVARVLDAGEIVESGAVRIGLDALGFAGPTVFIVSELVEGMPLVLWKACEEHTRAECEALLAKIDDAVVACHARGVIHGDISPANVIVSLNGTPRLVDFGRAAWIEVEGARGDVSRTDPPSGLPGARDQARLQELRGWLLRDMPPESEALKFDHAARVRRRRRQRVTGTLAVLLASALVFTLLRWTREPVAVANAAQLLFGISPLEIGAGAPLEHRLAREILETGGVASFADAQLLDRFDSMRGELAAARRTGSTDRGREMLLAAALAAYGDGVWPSVYAYAALRDDDRADAEVRRAFATMALGFNVPADQPATEDRTVAADALAEQLQAPGIGVLARRERLAKISSRGSAVAASPAASRRVP